MKWIVFGDDFGRHPSTIQHLMLQCPADDSVIWINSLGMRSPGFNLVDLRRVGEKIAHILGSKKAVKPVNHATPGNFTIINPQIVPFHLQPIIQAFNQRILVNQISAIAAQQDLSDSYLLTINPIVALYLKGIPYKKLIYLKLDDYALLPGVDPQLIKDSEDQLIEQADIIAVTAKNLFPPAPWRQKAHYLPQGVDFKHFNQASSTPPHSKTLGFFGLMAEWVDYDLIRAVAEMAPNWTLEFVGPVRFFPDDLQNFPNIKLCPALPYDALPHKLNHWQAAWIPFIINTLTNAVNPVKLREYLAMGLPVTSVPLASVAELGDLVYLSNRAQEIVTWLAQIEQDTPEDRNARKRAMEKESWMSRAADLRSWLINVD